MLYKKSTITAISYPVCSTDLWVTKQQSKALMLNPNFRRTSWPVNPTYEN